MGFGKEPSAVTEIILDLTKFYCRKLGPCLPSAPVGWVLLSDLDNVLLHQARRGGGGTWRCRTGKGKEEREEEGVSFVNVVKPGEILHWIPGLSLCPSRAGRWRAARVRGSYQPAQHRPRPRKTLPPVCVDQEVGDMEEGPTQSC